MALYEPPPLDLTPEKALTELLSVKSLYGSEPANIAPFCMERLKLARQHTSPRPPNAYLPAEARALLENFETLIEKSPDELADPLAPPLPTPYWDATLRTDADARRTFLFTLARRGLVSFRRKIKARAGLFFVWKGKKLVGAVDDRQIRLIVDARQAGACHQNPPHTPLGSARALREVNLHHSALDGSLGMGEPLSILASESDVDDAFYNWCNPTLASWFGLESGILGGDIIAAGITRVYDDDVRGFVAVRPELEY